MSTWLHLVCLDHTPPLVAEDESGQHLSDLPQIRADLAAPLTTLLVEVESAPSVDPWNLDQTYFRRRTVAFRAQHPHCRIGIRDEYGVEHSTAEGEA